MKQFVKYICLISLIGVGSCNDAENSYPVNIGPLELTIDLSQRGDTVTMPDYHCSCHYSMTLDAGVDSANYLWTPGGQISKTIQLPVINSELYTVEITTTDSSWIDSVFIYSSCIDCFTSIFIPNTFTPNGDGVNDAYYVYGCMEEVHIFVYNSSNTTLLYESNDQNAGWDGTYKGVLMPIGEYPYFVQASFCDGTSAEYRGTVQLLR